MDPIIKSVLYILYLSLLIILPDDSTRMFYLHSISLVTCLTTTVEKRFYVLMAMFHSALHNLWPFLSSDGYNPNYIAFYDVLWHTLSMLVCWEHIAKRNKSKTIAYLTMLFLVASMVNCVTSVFVSAENKFWTDVFVYTSITQAISTGYWVATTLWFDNVRDPSFIYHWTAWIVIMTANWFVYERSIELLKLSMKYRYIEGVFLVSTWWL